MNRAASRELCGYVLETNTRLTGQKVQTANRGKQRSVSPDKTSRYGASEKTSKAPYPGKPPKLILEDKLLVMLLYYREYRTYEHIGISFGISESRVCEIVQTMERILIADKRFHLPGKKQLLQADSEIEVVLIDVAESPIERLKKNNGNTIPERKRNTPLKHKS